MLNQFMNGEFFNFNSQQKQQGKQTLQGKIKHYLKETGRRHPALQDQSLSSIVQYKALQIVTAPFIYLCFIPTIAMDLVITLYQKVCFPLYGIPQVTRSEYVIIDRHKLKYLNLSKKINCVYCGYFTGVIAYAQEVAGRTEQYWCPVKHAAKLKNAHTRYKNFFDYGDAKGYREGFINIRRKYKQDAQPEQEEPSDRWAQPCTNHPAKHHESRRTAGGN
jgi:hypothetical protein